MDLQAVKASALKQRHTVANVPWRDVPHSINQQGTASAGAALRLLI
jgi:hypothetical protein